MPEPEYSCPRCWDTGERPVFDREVPEWQIPAAIMAGLALRFEPCECRQTPAPAPVAVPEEPTEEETRRFSEEIPLRALDALTYAEAPLLGNGQRPRWLSAILRAAWSIRPLPAHPAPSAEREA